MHPYKSMTFQRERKNEKKKKKGLQDDKESHKIHHQPLLFVLFNSHSKDPHKDLHIFCFLFSSMQN